MPAGRRRSIVRALAFAAALLPLAAAAGPGAGGRWQPFASADGSIDGIWRGQGYGRILVVGRRGRTLYHVAGRYCYRDPAGPDADDGLRLVRAAGRGRIVFAAAPGQTQYAFDRIPALPAMCAEPRRWTPRAIGALVAATFGDLYPGFRPGFRLRGRTPVVLAAALAVPRDLPSGLPLFRHLAGALDVLDDPHVGLTARIGGIDEASEGGEAATIRAVRGDPAWGVDPDGRERAWSRRYREETIAALDAGGHLVANRRILWGRIGRIGYLNIVTMGAFAADAPPDDTAALDSALDAALADFRDLPGVIVDVTDNRGGYDPIALRIAGRFADRRRLAFSKRAVGAKGAFQPFFVSPSARTRYLGPVLLLTSDVTVSAGETFTLAMRALPNVRHAGARTRGALSDQLPKPLPNGWMLTLPAEVYRDPGGRVMEGIGIAPDLTLPPFEPSHRHAIEEAARRLESRR